jgi:hypothetical protein
MVNAAFPKVGSIHAIAIRLTRLSQTGAPMVGAKNAFVSKALTKMSWSPTYKDPENIEETNGAGDICLTYKGDRKLTGADSKLEVCSPDPELEDILAGWGVLLNTAGDVVGGKAPAIGSSPNPYGSSIELWTRAVLNGSELAVTPYIRWVFTRGRWTQDERTAENAAMKPAYSGLLEENPSWGNGAFDDWDYASDRYVQYALDSALPTGNGYVTVPTQVP